jgi:hypothetical protein
VYYPLGGGFAAVLSKKVPGMQVTAEVTGGSVANMQLIGTGKPYIAFTQADAAIDALKGQDKFAGKPIPVRTPGGALSEPHARGDDRGHRDHEDGRHERQARRPPVRAAARPRCSRSASSKPRAGQGQGPEKRERLGVPSR